MTIQYTYLISRYRKILNNIKGYLYTVFYFVYVLYNTVQKHISTLKFR